MSENNYIERYWRDAKPEDAIKEPPMVARFRQDADSGRLFGCIQKLTGVDRDDDGVAIRWFSNKSSISFGLCQVYDAPDPGEGWRLVDTETEKPQDGDEYYSAAGVWRERPIKGLRFTGHDIYRRRITPTVTYVPFTWEDREQLRGRWIRREEDSGVTLEMPIEKLETDGRGLFLINGYTAKQMLDSWRFVDTGKPVGKEVAQ